MAACSTPDGIRGLCTERMSIDRVGILRQCSTPDGIRGLCTSPVNGTYTKGYMCSTPDGIRGLCTDMGGAHVLDILCVLNT